MQVERSQLVISLPSWEQFGMRRELESIGLSYAQLSDAFSGLINQAEDELSICSPFAAHEGLEPFMQDFQNALRRGVRIRFLTRISPMDGKGLGLRGLGRFMDEIGEPSGRRIEMRSYHYSDNSGLLSGIHAKLIIADREACYVGSGEFRTYSYEKNLEVGVILHGRPSRDLATLFDYLWGRSQALTIQED